MESMDTRTILLGAEADLAATAQFVASTEFDVVEC
jgi:hypothetical protein